MLRRRITVLAPFRDEIKEKISLKVFGQPLVADGQIDERIGARQMFEVLKSMLPR